MLKTGTSPRMRGKHPGHTRGSVTYGNIPAYAGKTNASPHQQSSQPEHPRVCGENLQEKIPRLHREGTSPRMRGKLPPTPRGIDHLRNIPAYAGKTASRTVRVVSPKEHPRVCGENNVNPVTLIEPNRNIPAYAGKTHTQQQRTAVPAEHPRVCGENRMIPRFATFTPGTSPRMRGKRISHTTLCCRHRNIPAYAGKTCRSKPLARSVSEHPRVCGENVRSLRKSPPLIGTSPRMRGKHLAFGNELRPIRNIPAYAGKTNGCVPTI